MDFDLFFNLLRDDPEPSSRSLLSNLPHKSLTDDSSISCNTSGHASCSQRNIANSSDPSQTGRVITKIENIFESIADCILNQEKELVISLKSRPKCKSRDSEESISSSKPNPEIKNITFPSRSPQEAWKFSESKMILQGQRTDPSSAALLRILELSHEALVTGIVTTKRFLIIQIFFFGCLFCTFVSIISLSKIDQYTSSHVDLFADFSAEIYITANQNCSSSRQLWTGMLMILHTLSELVETL